MLDLVAKAFLPAGGAAIVPIPTYPMYGILTDQRRAAVVRVPRRDRAAGYALDVDAVRAAAAEPADNGALPGVVWLCSPNNPTGRAEPEGAVADLLAGLAARRGRRRPGAPDGHPRRGVHRVRGRVARAAPRSAIPGSSCSGR